MVLRSRSSGTGWGAGAVVALCGLCVACGSAAPGTTSSATSDSPSSGTSVGGPVRVWLDRASFAPGEPITAHFTAPASFASDAWIGILPAITPHGSEAACDQANVAYEYLSGRTSGDVTLPAPERPGPWDVRMFDTDQDGREVASARFQVRPR